MRPHVVVEIPERIERRLQHFATGDDQLPEQRLERAEQPLHPPVLPRRAGVGGLVGNAHQRQERVEGQAVEYRLVVCAQAPGLAVVRNGQAQVPQQGPVGLCAAVLTVCSGERLVRW